MEHKPRIQERRGSIRHNMIYPAIYTRFDKQGRPFDEKPSRSVNISLGGVRLQSSFPVNPKEVLDVALALEDSLVTYKGEVVYVIYSQDKGFELGVSIKEIENGDRMALNRLKVLSRDYRDPEDDNVIIRMGQIVCPNCGEKIASVAKIKDMINYCKEFLGQCSCGQRYEIRISSSSTASLSFPDRQIDLIC